MSLLVEPPSANDNHVYGPCDDLDDEEREFDSYYQDDLEDHDDNFYDLNTNQGLCIVCESRPAYSKNGKGYSTCGLTCARELEQAQSDMLRRAVVARARGSLAQRTGMNADAAVPLFRTSKRLAPPGRPNLDGLADNMANLSFQRGGANTAGASSSRNNTPSNRLSRIGRVNGRGAATGSTMTTTVAPNNGQRQAIVVLHKCVVCVTKPCRDSQFVTCGLTCAEKLATSGPHDKTMCDYCHRRPKFTGKNQCGSTCAQKAKWACLLCKARPKLNRYQLCGRSCKQIAAKSTPLLLEAPEGHITFDQVRKKFQSAWKLSGTAIPTIKKVYKIIENKSFLQPYDAYKTAHGNKEVYRYHGTSKKCTLGNAGNTTLCNITGCALCSILRTSFKVSLANASGAFGAGVYSSSASNMAYAFSGNGIGALILTKAVLGTPYNVSNWNQVRSCPAGYHSVVFDNQGGSMNETIVYTDDAIRPVFLIVF